MTRRYDPNDLGVQLYKLCAGGRSPNTEPSSFADALGYFVRLASGNVSAAARLMGVPRRSVRDWLAGKSTPGADRRRAIAESAKLSARRDRMRPGREKRLRGADASGVKVVGTYNYDQGSRTADVGRYMIPSAMDRVVDAYLNGASPAELREVFTDGITDDFTGFYARTMAAPPDDEHGWTVTDVTL